MIEAQIEYMLKALDAIDAHRGAAIDVRPQAQAAFVAEMNRMAEGTVWTAGGCKSWYLDAHGNASTIWPDFTFRFRSRTKRFDTGDYELLPRVQPSPAGEQAATIPRRSRQPRRTKRPSPHEPQARPTFDVNGRTVFITGAARGIGAETAERLHAKGANVALVGLEPERLEELAAAPGRARAPSSRPTSPTSTPSQRAVRGTVERFGAIDVAIANAGIAFTGALATAPVEQVERTLDVNLLGVWRTDRAVIEQITRAARLPAEHRLAVGDHARAADGPLHDRQGRRRGAQRRAAHGERSQRRPRRLRLLRLHRHRPRARRLRAALGRALHRSQLPGFLSKPAPLSKAIDAIERGIERRAARVWAPRWVGPMIALRGHRCSR